MKRIYYSIVLLLSLVNISHASVWYVNASATGTGTGITWLNACIDISTAISNSISGDEIWVAAGVYKPSTTDPNAFYNLKAGIKLYGGFYGNETLLTQRDFVTNATVISGDIGTIGYPYDNIYQIFKASNLNILTIVDGFEIKDGTSNGSSSGAAAYISISKMKFANCKFNNNIANAGGAIYAISSSIVFEGCSFSNNKSTGDFGGAIYSYNTAINIFNSNFISNSSYAGGAVYFGTNPYFSSGSYIKQCMFTNNSTSQNGSSIKVDYFHGGIEISNCLMIGNYSNYGSVIDIKGYSSPMVESAHISNCTIAFNSANTSNLYFKPIRLFNLSSKKIENTIVWNNTGTSQLDAGYNVRNCLINGGYTPGLNIIDLNPMFINPPTFSNLPFIGNIADYNLNLLSPAIDAGDNAYASSIEDINNNTRIQNGNVDIGAIENYYCSFPLLVNASPNDSLCSGQVATLTANNGNIFLWSTGDTTNFLNTSLPGNYNLTGIDTSTHCRGTNSVSLYFQNPISISNVANICYNSSYTFPSGMTINNIITNMTDTSYFISSIGCDSMVIVQINVIPSVTNNQFISVCEGSDYTFPDGTTQTNITTPILHNSHLVSSNGCDSIISTSIQILPSYFYNEYYFVCEGSNYTFPDGYSQSNITTPISHYSYLLTSNGCDSIINTSIQITPNYFINEYYSVCEGSNYTFPDGFTQSNINIPILHNSYLVSSNGCDSIISTSIQILPSYFYNEYFSVCEGSNYTFPDGANSGPLSAPISHLSFFISSIGCDSTITTNLSIIPSYSIYQNSFTCQGGSFTYPDGITVFNVSTPQTHTSYLTSSLGCDSNIITTLNLHPTFDTFDTASVCRYDSYLFPDGYQLISVDTSVSHVNHLVSSQGCDSILTITLAVTSIDTSVTQTGAALQSNVTGLSYQWFDCNTYNPIAGATNQMYLATSNGNFGVSLFDGVCSDTSSCFQVKGLMINEINESEIEIYPNPTSSKLIITLNDARFEMKNIQLKDILGQEILHNNLHTKLESNKASLELNKCSNGLYLITITMKNGQSITRKIYKKS